MRVNEKTTSSAVTSRPWWNLTPLRSVNVHVNPSRDAFQCWASAGVMASVWSKVTSPSKICSATERP